MRGKGDMDHFEEDYERITPAHAGKSPFSLVYYQRMKDHPRTCGEKSEFFRQK